MNKLFLKGINLIQTWRAAIARRSEQRRDRAAFMALVWQEDRILSDVGYTRDDINWAVNLPIHMNAAKELEKCVRGANQAKAKDRSARFPGPQDQRATNPAAVAKPPTSALTCPC